MFKKELANGVVHKVPPDLKKALTLAPSKARVAWEDITPLARNEWICWVESVKKQETRSIHIKRVPKDLMAGKRRPCCWVGCMHR
ncbi:YdeI/OmpD-associated family protein [Candidatus Saccharibacteria bacterium]|nr:YdeI/OmpD-associated family protein [Candidatus Saccharibacteria bacterium]